MTSGTLDDAVFHGLGERIVHHDPGKECAVLILGRGGKIQPLGQANRAPGLELRV